MLRGDYQPGEKRVDEDELGDELDAGLKRELVCNEHALTCSCHYGGEGERAFLRTRVYSTLGRRRWKSLAPRPQRSAREDQVASCSGSVPERGEGEDPVIMCCVPPAYLSARLHCCCHSSNSHLPSYNDRRSKALRLTWFRNEVAIDNDRDTTTRERHRRRRILWWSLE